MRSDNRVGRAAVAGAGLVSTVIPMPGPDTPDLQLPGWTIEVTERSPGVWRLMATHAMGPTFEAADANLNHAFEQLKDLDRRLSKYAQSTTVQIEDVRAGLMMILDEIQRKFGDEINFGTTDSYWNIAPDKIVDLEKDPTPDIGQVSDDIASLRELLQRTDGQLFVWHDLTHIVGILRRIAALDLPPR